MIKIANNLINLVLKQSELTLVKQSEWWNPTSWFGSSSPAPAPAPAPAPVPATWKEVPPYSVTVRKLMETAYQGNKAVTQQSIDAARLNQKNHPEYMDPHTPIYSDAGLDKPRGVASVYGSRDAKGDITPLSGNAAYLRPRPLLSTANSWGKDIEFLQKGPLASESIFGRPNMEGGQPIYDDPSGKTYLKPNSEFTPAEQAETLKKRKQTTGNMPTMSMAEIGHHEGTHSLRDFSTNLKALVRRIPEEQPGVLKDFKYKYFGGNKPEYQHLGTSQEFPAGIAETKSHLYRTQGLHPVYDTPAKVETYMQNLNQLQQQNPSRYGQMYNYLQSLSPEDRMIHLGMIAQNTATKGPYGQQPVKMQA